MGHYSSEMDGSPGPNHNNPPEVLELASGVISSISAWMADHPVVETEDAAREMHLHIDRAEMALRDLETERDGKVRPLNHKVNTINGTYRKPRVMLEDLHEEMLARVQVFVKVEKARRELVAQAAAAKAREAELAALEAERIERERIDDASKGEIGINVADVIKDADEAFEAFTKAERARILAQKETHVKIGGGLSRRAMAMKKVETLHIVGVLDAIGEIGLTEDIAFAILKSARTFRKLNGRLPKGIISKVEEHL